MRTWRSQILKLLFVDVQWQYRKTQQTNFEYLQERGSASDISKGAGRLS
jgi:hypothetical protein